MSGRYIYIYKNREIEREETIESKRESQREGEREREKEREIERGRGVGRGYRKLTVVIIIINRICIMIVGF